MNEDNELLQDSQTESPPNELTDERIDELVAGTEKATNRDMPMEQPKTGAKDATQKTPDEQFHEFKHNGKTVRATPAQLIRWAQQGIDAPQKFEKLKDQQKFDQERTQWEQKWGMYRQVDEWATKNPQIWQQLVSQFQRQGQSPQQAQASAAQAVDPALQNKISQLEAKLGQLEPIAQEFLSEKEKARNEGEDNKLNQEIQSIREKHKDLDWKTLDENGNDLERLVLAHGIQHGISKFSAAFYDLTHEQLLSGASANAKIAMAQGIQQRTKLGILDSKSTPKQRGLTELKDVKRKSYEEAAREGLEELRAGTL